MGNKTKNKIKTEDNKKINIAWSKLINLTLHRKYPKTMFEIIETEKTIAYRQNFKITNEMNELIKQIIKLYKNNKCNCPACNKDMSKAKEKYFIYEIKDMTKIKEIPLCDDCYEKELTKEVKGK